MEQQERTSENQTFVCNGITVTVSFSSGGKSLQDYMVEILAAHLAQDGEMDKSYDTLFQGRGTV